MSSSVVSGQAPEVDEYAECHASVADIPNSEKLALLKMRYGNDLAKVCVALGRTIGWEEPGPSAWRSLFRRRWITRDYSFRNAPRGVLALTWLGLQRQRELAHAMARTSNLHFMLETTDSRYSVTVRCTCGWSASLSKNQGHINTGQLRAYAVHSDSVAQRRNARLNRNKHHQEVTHRRVACSSPHPAIAITASSARARSGSALLSSPAITPA